MKEIGMVLTGSNPNRFQFKVSAGSQVLLHDYVIVQMSELSRAIGRPLDIKVLCEVTRLRAENSVVTPELSISNPGYTHVIGSAEVIGYLDNGRIEHPRTAAIPGTTVYEADDEFLKDYFRGSEADVPVYPTVLLNRPQIRVPVFLQRMDAHLGIFASSLAHDEPLLYREDGVVKSGTIGGLVDRFYPRGGEGAPVSVSGIEVVSFNRRDYSVSWRPISYVYRHAYRGRMLRIDLDTGRSVTVTPNHAIFTFERGAVVCKDARGVKPGDYLIGQRRITREPSRGARAVSKYPDLALFKVSSVSEVEQTSDYVYDVSVPGDENFMAGSGEVFCHNTRAGKSVLCGKLMEEILERTGLPVIVLDMHGDYTMMDTLVDGTKHKKFDTVVYYPQAAKQIQGVTATVKELTFSARDLEVEEYKALLGSTLGELQEVHLYEVFKHLRAKNTPFGSEDVMRYLNALVNETNPDGKYALPQEERGRIQRILMRAERFHDEVRLPPVGTDLDQMLKPHTLSVICLNGMRAELQDAFAGIIVNAMFKRAIARKKGTPFYLIIEEAHRLLSENSSTKFSLDATRTAIREGAKFGMTLVLVSQRPSTIDQSIIANVVNLAVLRIVNQADQKMIEDSSESFSHRLIEDLPGLNVGEAILTGTFVPMPVHVRTAPRETIHHGATPELRKFIDAINKKDDKEWS